MRRLFRIPATLYHWKCGWLLGHRFLLLIHTGRRPGLRRHTVLEIMEFRGNVPEMVVMSGFGPGADWLRDIQATPGAEVIVGAKRFPVVHRILDEEEALTVITGYERRHRLLAPVVRAVLSRLLGWRYDSSERDRRRLVAQLPFVAFRVRR
jgi:deazaflavin-dependent oxidoreductase (nitroreductase family)